MHRTSRQRGATVDTSWALWQHFCATLGLDALALGTCDRITLLQLYAQRYCTGSISPGRNSVRARTVEDAVRAVGQAYARLGAPDPRLTVHGTVDFRLTSMYRAWQKEDSPPTRVKPLPLPVVAQVWALASADASPFAVATAECLVLGFFFLLRPGEYLGVPRTEHGPIFRVQDVRLWIGDPALSTLDYPEPDLLAATFVTFTFTTQKNGVRNETIGHGRSGHPHLCPVLCAAARLLALRRDHAVATTPLNAVRPTPTAPLIHVLSSDATARIRAALVLHPDPAYSASDVSARSTRAGGAMALLCAGIDRDRIRLVGRWRSDEMYRYLHVQAQPVMNGLAAAMLRGGSFRLTPS